MIISDYLIREFMRVGLIKIDPVPDDDCFQPCTVELKLGSKIITYEYTDNILEKGGDFKTRDYELMPGGFYIIKPNELIIAETEESIENPDWLSCDAKGKSGWARMGISIHQTAGYIDPFFSGKHLTLEIVNHNPNRVKLYRGNKICQVQFTMIASHVDRAYGHEALGSHYQNQKGAMV